MSFMPSEEINGIFEPVVIVNIVILYLPWKYPVSWNCYNRKVSEACLFPLETKGALLITYYSIFMSTQILQFYSNLPMIILSCHYI